MNNLPVATLRYIVLFPICVSILVMQEAWIEASASHLLTTTILFIGTHLILQSTQTSLMAQSTLDTPPDEADEFPQRLGLREPEVEYSTGDRNRPSGRPSCSKQVS
ncbi:hypothetical protein [Tunturiibacter lichenicola]|uniref:hypothetical protein n=1 Tax=Tunturiibacter lichenicola TaxID=2051959 RepID=UPI003D9AF564